MATSASPKKNSTLGQILKNEGYEELMKRILTLDEKEYKNFIHTDSEKPVSQLDLMLFHVPDFFYIKDAEGKNTQIAQPGALEFVDWALQNTASVNQGIKYGHTTWLKAAQMPTSDLLEHLLTSVPSLNITQQDGRGLDALMHAVASNSLDNVEVLMATQKFDINKSYILFHKKTPLHLAFSVGEEALVEKLLSHGADLTLKDEYDHVPCDMTPTQKTSVLSEDEITPEQLAQWEDIFTKYAQKTQAAVDSKKTKKVHKTAF